MLPVSVYYHETLNGGYIFRHTQILYSDINDIYVLLSSVVVYELSSAKIEVIDSTFLSQPTNLQKLWSLCFPFPTSTLV